MFERIYLVFNKNRVRRYRKIPKINSKALFEELIFGGAYIRREICVSKSIGLALLLEVNLPFLLCFTLYLRAISKYKPPGGLIFGGAIERRVFCVTSLGRLYTEGHFSGILRYFHARLACEQDPPKGYGRKVCTLIQTRNLLEYLCA